MRPFFVGAAVLAILGALVFFISPDAVILHRQIFLELMLPAAYGGFLTAAMLEWTGYKGRLKPVATVGAPVRDGRDDRVRRAELDAACMACSIAEAYYEIPDKFLEFCYPKIALDLKIALKNFLILVKEENRFNINFEKVLTLLQNENI